MKKPSMARKPAAKEKKAKKPPKPASMFRKPIAERAFNKKYLGLLEQVKDREFFASAFDLAEGSYRLKAGLDRPSLLRLNGLAKAIKANRGFVKTGPLILVTLLGIGLVVFYLFFMNPLLEKTIESALESAFGARAEVSALRLDLLRFRLAMASVVVADRDDPMTNLFEAGRIELRLNPASLVRGRVYIEEASAASMAVGTSRKVSGALPGVAAKPKAEKAAREAGAPLVDFKNFDAKALLEREKDKLKVTAAYAEAAKAYEEASARWQDRADSSQQAVARLESSAKTLLALDVKSIKTAAEVTKAISDVKAVGADAQTVGAEAKAISQGIRADVDKAKALEKSARSAITEDFAHLKSYIDPKSGAAMEALEPSIREILSDKAERYVYYGQRALEVALKLKEVKGDPKEKKGKAVAVKGRDVVFPSEALPRFRLGLFGSSFAAAGADWKFELRELSTEPDLVNAPTSLALAYGKGGASVLTDAIADLRTSASEAYSVAAKVKALPVDLGDLLKSLGLGGFSGSAFGDLELHGAKDGAIDAKSALSLREARVREASGTLGEAIAEAVKSVESVELAIGYAHSAGKADQFSLDSNLDVLVSKAVRIVAERYAKQAAADLEAALKEYVGAELEGKLGSKGDLDQLVASVKGDEQATTSIKNSLDSKVKELEAKAKAQGAEALKGILPGTSTIPTAPSVPGLPSLPGLPKKP